MRGVHPPRSAARTARAVLLYVVAPALMLGFVAMHVPTSDSVMTDQLVMSTGSNVVSADHAEADLSPDPSSTMTGSSDRHHDDGGTALDCGPLMIMCLALLLVAVVLGLMTRYDVGRFLWQRPRLIRRIGAAKRFNFASLTPLQQSCVLRC